MQSVKWLRYQILGFGISYDDTGLIRYPILVSTVGYHHFLGRRFQLDLAPI